MLKYKIPQIVTLIPIYFLHILENILIQYPCIVFSCLKLPFVFL